MVDKLNPTDLKGKLEQIASWTKPKKLERG
jgi:hypothetical protein